MITYHSWIIDFLILLGILGASALICFIADALGLSLLEQDNRD